MIELKKINFRINDRFILKDLDLAIEKGQIVVICGKSGSGKSVLAKIISREIVPDEGAVLYPDSLSSKLVDQQHNIRPYLGKSAYYQMRYDNILKENIPKVKDLFTYLSDSEVFKQVFQVLRIEELYHKQLIELSNGENKRFQIALSLVEPPEILILDHPFTGLDKFNRAILLELVSFFKENKIGVVVFTEPQHIPENFDMLYDLVNGKLSKNVNYSDHVHISGLHISLPEDLKSSDDITFTNAVLMKNVHVSYGENKVLNNVSWQVKKGECWALTGPNGSGKSTLLSLINGDNPKAYLNKIEVFDTQRGSGDSIWEIKKMIGFVSPELHMYFQRNPSFTETLISDNKRSNENKFGVYTCFDCVASGFSDLIGSTEEISSLKKRQVRLWFKAFQMEDLIYRPFSGVSAGQQRAVLLARALVKNPPLLILDEPCQGLDFEQVSRFKSIVSEVCRQLNKTLIYVSHYEEEIPDCVNNFFKL